MTKEKVAILIKKTSLIIDKYSNQILSPYDLTNTQYKILMMLFHYPNKEIRQIDIEKKFSLTNPTVTGIIKNLEKKGLVERIINSNDKRSKIVKVTKLAISKQKEIEEIGESLEKKISSELTEEEYVMLSNLLLKVLATNI